MQLVFNECLWRENPRPPLVTSIQAFPYNQQVKSGPLQEWADQVCVLALTLISGDTLNILHGMPGPQFHYL